MFNVSTSKQYWNKRSSLFANYYIAPSKVDKIFRKAIYRRAEVAASVIEKLNRPTLLDVGCGPAINIVNWVNRFPDLMVTGIDFAPEMVAYANNITQQNGLQLRLKLILGDFSDYDFKEDKFDISTALGVFDYTKNAFKILEKMRALSKKYIVGSWPSDGIRMSLRRLRYTCPLYAYTINQVIEMHQLLGISDIEISSQSSSGFTTIARLDY